MKRLLAALSVSAALTGCTTSLALQGLNGAGSCPPEAFREAQNNLYNLQYVQPGMSLSTLQSMLSGPEKAEKLTLSDGSIRIANLYRTGHPRCRDTGSDELTPVVLNPQGTVIAVGAEAYRQITNRVISRTSHNFTPSKPFSLSRLLLYGPEF